MSKAKIIDGKKLSNDIKKEVASQVAQLKLEGVSPGLAVVLVGDDPASQVYVRNKASACDAAGIYSKVINLPAHTKEHELLKVIQELNNDEIIHGILVQLPLPAHIN